MIEAAVPLAAGKGSLTLARSGARTVATRLAFTSPLRLMVPKRQRGPAWVYVASLGGGLVDGDALALDIDLEPGAEAFFTTQASTKAYRAERGVRQTTKISAARDSLSLWLPDPLSCFERASVRQETLLSLAPSASAIVAEAFTAGRSEFGERWKLSSLSSRLRVEVGGEAIADETVFLSPREGPIAERMGRFDAIMTSILVGPRLVEAGARIVESIGVERVVPRAGVVESASPLSSGAVALRMAATSVEALSGAFRARVRPVVADALGEDPWARKG